MKPRDAGDGGNPLIELEDLAQRVKDGLPCQPISVRRLLGWFGAQRRGLYVVQAIREQLSKLGVETAPDFNDVWIDSDIKLVAIGSGTEILPAGPGNPDTHAPIAESAIEQPVQDVALVGGPTVDPTYKIGKLNAANQNVVSVKPNESLVQAITLMLAHGFSQLPVMQNERDVKGVLSWESVGSRLALGAAGSEAKDFMVPAQIIPYEQSLFAAVEIIVKFQYVLVQAPDRKITGIVTAADLSGQFHQLSEPFLLLGEIEQHIRSLIGGKFTKDELKSACDPSDSGREVRNVADLTLGEYVRLMENPANWQKIGLKIDRPIIIAQLNRVRLIRNDVMHFDQDQLATGDLSTLRNFALFMRWLRELGASA
jgi:CBS domain-containing protein